MIEPNAERADRSVPERLLARLDALGEELARRGDALALVGHGSVGVDLHRLDEHSDADFFVIVEDAAKQRYLDAIDWLEALAPVAFSFENSVDGRKVLFADGLFAEYAVFTLAELDRADFAPGRVVWRREDAPEGLEVPRRVRGPSPYDTPGYQANEALTNLYVGLHRELRGERLAAMRLIQVHAIDRLITFLGLVEPAAAPQQDPFAPERGVERRFPSETLPLDRLVQGYERSRESALALLAWLEARPEVEVDETLAAAIRALAG